LNNVVFSPLLSSGVGVAVMLGGTELVEVMLTELVKLVGPEVVESDSTSRPPVVLGLGVVVVVSVLRLGMSDAVAAIVDPSSLLTAT